MPPQMINMLMQQAVTTEIIYSFVIIICSLMIYFGTKELYELSSHKGIKYFRLAFLFFAIAYFFRYFIKFFMNYFNLARILDIPPHLFGEITGPGALFLFMYFSSMSIFYLLYSVMWKKWNNNSKRVYAFHALALIFAATITLVTTAQIYLILNLILFLFILAIVLIGYKNCRNKKGHNLYAIYLLLSAFWILNILDILVPTFLQTYQILIYLASIGIFLTILYKVLSRVGN